MTNTLIIACPKCHKLLLTKQNQKTRTCPHCNATVLIEKAKTIATAANAVEASQILKKLKAQQNQNPETETFHHL